MTHSRLFQLNHSENVDNKSVADNLIALKDLITRSNALAGQGTLSDRIGQSAEVVLDAQVNILQYLFIV